MFLRAAMEIAGDLFDRLFREEEDDGVLLDLPMCKQLDGYSCGVEVTRSVLRYYGMRPSRRELKELLGTTKADGTNELAIQAVLKDFGMGTRIIEDGRLRDLRRCLRNAEPVLVTIDEGEHWVVVTGYGDGRIYVMDPRPWVVTERMSSEDFQREWCEGWGIAVARGRYGD